VTFLRFALVAGLASLPIACSSTVEGQSDAPKIKTWDIAVGATVTLHVGDDGRCSIDQGPSPYVCPEARSIARITKAEIIGGDGALTVVRTRSERFREDEMLVDVRADHPGGASLKITFEDRVSGTKTAEFPVRALPITHVDEKVGCQFQFDASAHRYPISKESKVGLALEAKHNEVVLLSGALNLVADGGGLPPTDVVDSEGELVSRSIDPDRTGTFTWKLAGERPNTVVLDVYDPENVGVTVSSPEAHQVSVRSSVNGAPTCFYGGTHRAMTRISGGACKLIVGEYEADGDLPVSLARGGETFLVEGSGQCTVEARIASGPAGSTTLEGKVPELVKVPSGDVLGTTPIEKGGTMKNREACLRVTKISNGKCEAINAGGYFVIPDGDCIVDFDWFADPYEGDTPNTHPVGVGLLTELRIGLRLQLFGLVTLKPLVPNALKWDSTPLEVRSLGCDNVLSNYEALAIRPAAEGHHSLHFNADNSPEPLDYDVHAKTIGSIRYVDGDIDVRNGTSYHFLRSEVDLKVAYLDSGGGPLRGIAPVRMSSSDPAANAVYANLDVFTGTAPNRITLASPAAPMTHAIEAVDVTAVTTIANLTPKPGPQDVVCVEPYPQVASGQRIHGRSPTRPRISVSGGDACGIVGGFVSFASISTGKNELCAAAVAGRPSAAITINWGSATTTWPCQATR
jgi:hypothetical protein